MMVIHVDGTRVCIENYQPFVQGTVGLQANVQLSEEWDGLAVTAVFATADNFDTRYPVSTGSGTITIPWEVLSEARAHPLLSFDGRDSGGDLIRRSSICDLGEVAPSMDPLGETPTPTPPYPDWYENVYEAGQQALQSAQDAEAYAKGTRGGTEVGTTDPTYHNNAKYFKEQAEAIRDSIPEDYTELAGDVSELKSAKADLPTLPQHVDFSVNNGIIRTNLTVYTQGESYPGRYISIPVNSGDAYIISGRSTNASYPCCFVTKSDNTVITLLDGSAQNYFSEEVTIPDDATTMYVNGGINTVMPDIYKKAPITQEDFNGEVAKIDLLSPYSLKCLYQNGVLYIKKKYNANRDIIISFGNIGGNSLFNFRSCFYVENTDATPNNLFSDAAAIATWTMSGSDWLGPYTVKAVNNGNGDTPDNVYFTGGNHRTTNTATGGGVTAVQDSLNITLDGKPIQDSVIYPCNRVSVEWTNTVQAYNTSKADGSGRGVLTETWELVADENGIHLHNTIKALEDIIISIYYGFQTTCPGKSIRYIGGSNRAVYAIGTGTEASGNKTCRQTKIFDNDFSLTVNVEPIDLGLFEHTGVNSFARSPTKTYSQIIVGEDVNVGANTYYDLFGDYIFE